MAEKKNHKQEKPRMKDKLYQPTEELVTFFMGEEAWARLMKFESMLKENYSLNREMRFPFGSNYGWGFRYTHKNSLLLHVFFEEGGFCCTISINDAGAPKVDSMFDSLHPELQTCWVDRYACGEKGGWLHRSVESDDELPDLVRLLSAKVKPVKRK